MDRPGVGDQTPGSMEDADLTGRERQHRRDDKLGGPWWYDGIFDLAKVVLYVGAVVGLLYVVRAVIAL